MSSTLRIGNQTLINDVCMRDIAALNYAVFQRLIHQDYRHSDLSAKITRQDSKYVCVTFDASFGPQQHIQVLVHASLSCQSHEILRRALSALYTDTRMPR
jgi:hypothetical protein